MSSNGETMRNRQYLLKFIVFSVIGAFMFFVSIPYNGKSTIPLDHLTTIIRNLLGDYQKYWVLILMVFGVFWGFYKKTWNKDVTSTIFTVFKILGTICAIMYIWNIGPEFLMTNDNLFPYLFGTLCQSLAFLIPLGAIFLAFLTNYGLMEFVGVLVQPIMRPVWKTPGRSAIDAVSSFVGSYSLALLITDKVYQDGKYTKKEAAIIATGFSTVSTTFMIVVAQTLDLMGDWNFYFWTTLVITFIITAISARIYPISKIPDEYKEGVTPKPEETVKEKRFRKALQEALDAAAASGNIGKNVWESFRDGIVMCASVLSTIMAIGLLGMLIALYTPVFDIIGYIFLPFAAAVQLPEATVAAQALATSIAEMSLPTVFVTGASMATRYVVAVTCISEIIFFSAVVPCIMSTSIPIKMRELIMIWVERVILSILLAGVVALIFL